MTAVETDAPHGASSSLAAFRKSRRVVPDARSGQQFEDGDIFVYDPDTDFAEMLFDEDNLQRNEDVDAVFVGLGNGEINFLELLS